MQLRLPDGRALRCLREGVSLSVQKAVLSLEAGCVRFVVCFLQKFEFRPDTKSFRELPVSYFRFGELKIARRFFADKPASVIKSVFICRRTYKNDFRGISGIVKKFI